MKLRIAFLVVAVVWTSAFTQSSLGAQAARTVADGVYTDAQTERGLASYKAACLECHGADLTGDGFAPALAGPEFLGNWTDLSVGDLFERIRISMPPSGPAGLKPEEKIDIVAYMLKYNKFPAGKTELEAKLEGLKQIKIEQKK
jgi:mono/diheme cytochrome c family protein